jgi:hypothetical protein
MGPSFDVVICDIITVSQRRSEAPPPSYQVRRGYRGSFYLIKFFDSKHTEQWGYIRFVLLMFMKREPGEVNQLQLGRLAKHRLDWLNA